jgi:hypothetical protein
VLSQAGHLCSFGFETRVFIRTLHVVTSAAPLTARNLTGAMSHVQRANALTARAASQDELREGLALRHSAARAAESGKGAILNSGFGLTYYRLYHHRASQPSSVTGIVLLHGAKTLAKLSKQETFHDRRPHCPSVIRPFNCDLLSSYIFELSNGKG